MPPLRTPPPPNPCEMIKQCLSPNSCSSSTVSLLNETLFPRASTSTTPGGKALSSRQTSKKPAAARARQATADGSKAPPLAIIDRSRLAIEVINSILRTLSDVTKSTDTRIDTSPPLVGKPKARVPGRLGSKVLQSRHGNSSDSPPGSTDAIDHLADCCSISISFLISIESTEGVPNMQPLQTENARLSLSSKLIQLGRFERALNELKQLKGRLELAIESRNGVGSWLVDDSKEDKMATQKAIVKIPSKSKVVGKENIVNVDSKTEREELPILLDFPHISTSNTAFPLIIGFQLGVLRCITGLKLVEMIEAILPSLSSLGSPLAFIKALAKSSPSKALSHVITLSQILASLTPTTATNTNTVALHNHALSNPNTTITLQALQIECLALQQALRPDEMPKNLWGTFEKHLATYIRRTQSQELKHKSERYILVRDMVEKMKKLLNRKDDNELFPLEVYKLVCSVASDANLINESIRWTEDWLNALDRTGDNANVALAVLCKVRLAVLELKSLRLVCVSGTVPGIERLEDLEAKVSVAIEGLGSVVRGRKHDLELLLQETGQLRRNSLGLLTAMPHDGPKVADTSTHVVDRSTKAIGKKVRCICDQAFKSVVQFCRKYMSMGISEEEHSQLQLILVPAIDTILSACLSGFDTECFESWENAESLLCECSAAVKVMERERPGYIDRFYERLSNVYYQIYLLYRKSPGSESKATRALRRSVSIMDQRPTSELVTASVSRKYQILGSSYLAARDYRRSEDAFLLAIKIAATTGSLNKFEEQATHSESVRQLVNSTDKEIVMIGAILTGLVKIASRKNDGVAAELRFDDIGLSVAIRGLLLEWTLSLALDQMDDDGSVMRTVGERLLDIYELEEMPIRRSRVIAKLLGLSVDRPNLLDPEAMRGLGEEVLEWANSISFSDLDEDTNLQAFKDDVVAHCSIGLGFSVWVHGTPQPELVWNAFRLWNGIIQHEGSWLGISNRIDNANKVIKRLEMAVEFFGMKGEADLRLAALGLLLEFRKLERPVNSNALITTYTRLGLQYLRLGYSGKAGMSIGKAQVWLKRSEDNITTATQLEWHLAYTEYLVGIGNLEKGLQCFYAANIIASQDEDLSSAKSSGAKIAERIRVNMIIADAAYVTSLIAFEKGNANESLLHARRCVRLNSRAWAGLENLGKDFSPTKSRITDTLSANMQALSLSGSKPREYSASHDALNLPKLWPLVSSLHLGYIQAANIYRHLGMIRESIYFMNHALKTVEAVDAKPSIDRTKVMLGDLKVRCGEMNEGSAMLENAGQSIGGGRAMVSFQIAVGNLERLNGNLEAEIEAYRRAEEALNSLVTNIMNKAEKSGNSELSNQIEQLSSSGTEKSPPRRPKTPTRRGGRAATALKSADAKLSSEKEVPPIESECTTLLKQKGDIQRLIARSMALQGECESATETLEQAAKLPAGNQEIISQGLVEAINHLQKAFSLVSSDPVFSSLQESTISLPSVTLSLELVRSSMASPVKKSIRKVTVKKTKAFIEVLEQARDCLLKVHSKAMRSGSSTTIPRVASLLTSIIVLLSAMTDLKGRGPEHPLFASYSLELQKGLATQREKLVVETEKHGAIAQETLQWPEIGASGVITATLDAAPFEFSSFRAEYIDIIPKEWAAVSVTMSENRKELYITRFQAEKSQLMVRLPLNRHNSRDDCLALIEYDAAMEELKEIIQRSNASTHQAKYMENKADRAQWWSERQELDDQMNALLEGIERAWLGGFKGIFSQYPKNPALFARFKASFDKVLSKLPSRKRKKAGKVDIDPRILELFIALGNPEGQDLDEALTDLIFFVVDILQFHGEGNAYDEIDIDTMVIAMTGALTAYHDEASFNPEEVKVEVDHIILILDKSVQMLPWESMPCLRGHSVSRLPSLAALRNRIVQMQGTITHPSRPGYYITRTSGGYILNPDSDLKSTQKMFENDLKALPGQWTGIVNRSPTEEEFKEILVNSDVLLYFGHGSGAHYIPARTIRKLDRCAVACLMGCSSGSLKDAGEFEPYGMPTNYLLAGCPAVLANLWDVTDKDIDKFTKEVFGKWGLLVTEPIDKKRAGKKHGNSLVEAVAAARDKCVMRYLNGAAPVVYGIPAYFG